MSTERLSLGRVLLLSSAQITGIKDCSIPILYVLLGPAERDVAGHDQVSKHLSGDPSLFLHSLPCFLWSNENKVWLLAGAIVLAPEHIQREFEHIFFLSLSLSQSVTCFSSFPRCQAVFHSLQLIRCLTYFSLSSFFRFLAPV